MDGVDINQIALFASSGCKRADDIIKLVLGNDIDCTCSFKVQDEGFSVTAYPWHVSTKYYEADVHLCSMTTKGLAPQHLASAIQAVLLYFDSDNINGLEIAEGWLPFLNEYCPEVKIMLCDRCVEETATGVNKRDAQEWCVKNGFELVELDPEIDVEWEREQDFIETTGIKRVIQALHSHVWPYLTMKERKEPTSFNGLLHGNASQTEDSRLNSKLQDLQLELEHEDIEKKIEELLGGGLSSEGDMDFSTLFGQLQEMKERVSSMPNEHRKACAEQVVLAFWKAIGGDSEEVDMPEDG